MSHFNGGSGSGILRESLRGIISFVNVCRDREDLVGGDGFWTRVREGFWEGIFGCCYVL